MTRRSRELCPDPICPDTSRHEAVPAPAGDPMPRAPWAMRRPKPKPAPGDPSSVTRARASPRPRLRADLERAELGGPRTSCSRRPPATSPRFHVEAANRGAPPLRSARAAADDVLPGTVERSSRPSPPLAQPARATRPPRAKGRLTRCSAKSNAIRRTRGAFPRRLPPARHQACARVPRRDRQDVFHRLSPAWGEHAAPFSPPRERRP